jgi:hypothetical protein
MAMPMLSHQASPPWLFSDGASISMRRLFFAVEKLASRSGAPTGREFASSCGSLDLEVIV